MPIQAKLGGVRKVGTEFQEEGTEVLIHAIAIEVVHHSCGLHNPGIGVSGLGIAALLGTEHRGLLLGFTDEEDSFGFVESGQVRLHHIIFALTLLELHNRNLLLFRKSVHGGYESLGHRVEEANLWPPCWRKNFTTPPSDCSIGT